MTKRELKFLQEYNNRMYLASGCGCCKTDDFSIAVSKLAEFLGFPEDEDEDEDAGTYTLYDLPKESP